MALTLFSNPRRCTSCGPACPTLLLTFAFSYPYDTSIPVTPFPQALHIMLPDLSNTLSFVSSNPDETTYFCHSLPQALHIMLPDLSDTATADFKQLSDSFKDREGVEVVPTFVPAAQINSEIEFELEHNLTNSHDGERETRPTEAAQNTISLDQPMPNTVLTRGSYCSSSPPAPSPTSLAPHHLPHPAHTHHSQPMPHTGMPRRLDC